MEAQSGKVLIIDDDPIILNMLTVILENDYVIVCTEDSVEGLTLAKEESPDLILLDINMPLLDGHALCRLLLTSPETNKIPIVFITARSSAEEEAIGLKAGASDYITKPIITDIVKARVKIQVEVKQQRDYLEKLSTTDPLTGVANRRCFDEALEREWRRSLRNKKPLSMVAIDIDCFKLYNDRYGHVAGDQCLKQVAKTLTEVLHRGGDLLARVGGEEFIALMPDTPFEALESMAEKFRSAIEDAKIPHESSFVAKVVTISAGAMTLVPTQQMESGDLYNMADKLLLLAKEKGRNQVCVEESAE